MSEPDCSQQAYAEAKHEYETRREGEVSDIVERARLVQRVNAHWYDSICECEECTQERFSLITPMAYEIERLRARLAEAEHDAKQAHGVAQALERDAARYRWLRDRAWPFEFKGDTPADADAAIDAAMRPPAKKHTPRCSYWDGLFAQACNCGAADNERA